jgi:FkbM family methyltransferase
LDTNFVPYLVEARAFGEHSIDFLVADETARDWYDDGTDQQIPERRWVLENVKPGFTVVDVGGHHGLFSILFSRLVGPTGRVLTWEASPRNAEILAGNLARNGCENVMVTVHGLGAARAQVRFKANGGNTIVGNEAVEVASDTVMEVHRLDDELPSGTKVDLLKIDVEGSELAVLRGAPELLAQRPIIDLEIHNFLMADPRGFVGEIFAILDAQGYHYAVLPEPISAMVEFGAVMDLDWLAGLDNPHVFCRVPG